MITKMQDEQELPRSRLGGIVGEGTLKTQGPA